MYFSGTYFSSGDLQFFSGTTLTWSNLNERYTRKYFSGEIEFYSINYSLLLLLRNLVIYYVCIFIFESTLESNQGVSRSFWSVFCGCFSSKSKSQKKKNDYDRLESPPDSIHFSREFEMTAQSPDSLGSPPKNFSAPESHIGMKVANLSKTFTARSCLSFLCCRKPEMVRACDDISFEIERGKLVTILGQNGAGKTTLINILTGYLEPSWGEAWIAGRTLSESTQEIRENTSLCPQFDIYWPSLTIEEHLQLFSVIKGLHEKEALSLEVDRTLELVGLEAKRKERVDFLSGGMRRRLAIAISTISDPKIIFFDEPTTGLDPVTKDQILTLIKSKYFIFLWTTVPNKRPQER